MQINFIQDGGGVQIEGLDLETVAYHCKILVDAGLIESYIPTSGDNRIYAFSVGSLTWEGHDFLDKIQEKTIWNKAKNKIKENTLPFTIEVIKGVATAIINKRLEGLL